MSKKRKTREQKIKASQKKVQNKITYSVDFEKSSPNKISKSSTLQNVINPNDDIKRILTAGGIIILANIVLFILLYTNILHFGFLGY